MAKPFHVVEFLKDKSTYAVPEWWLQRNETGITAFWPPFSSKQQVIQAMRRHEPITRHWVQHDVKILHSYSTLQQALDKLKDAELTSNLDSDDEEEPIRKRPRGSRVYTRGGPPPGVQPRAPVGPVLPVFPATEPDPYESHVYHNLDDGGHFEAGPWQGPDQQQQQLPLVPTVRQDWCAPNDLAGPSNVKQQVMEACREIMKQQTEACQVMLDQQAALWEKVLRNQAEILAKLGSLSRQRVGGMAGTPTLPEDCPPLPVQTAEELKELNSYLGNREKLEMMADYFRQNGGPDYKVAGRTIMSMLVSNSLAKVCSWAGSKGSKEAFADHHNILALVLAALRPKFPDLDKTTVAAVVKRWLYSASDREGGRNQRRADKANSIE